MESRCMHAAVSFIDADEIIAHLVEMRSTPFGGVFACMPIEYSKKALPTNTIKVDNERMRVFHGSSRTLVFRDTDLKRAVLFGVSIENLLAKPINGL